jgi:hypothetical protein
MDIFPSKVSYQTKDQAILFSPKDFSAALNILPYFLWERV